MGVYKKGNTYWMFKQFRGRRIEKSLETSVKRVAEDRYARIINELIDGKYFINQKSRTTTFRMLAEKYQHKYKRLRDDASLKKLLPAFGHLMLADVTTEIISDYQQARLRVVKPATVYQELSLMRRMFNVGRRELNWTGENPVANLSFSVGNKNARDRWLTAAEEETLLQKATNPSWLRLLLLTALHTGMRRGEILNLKWQDIDCQRRLIVVRHSKNGDKRPIPLSMTLHDALKDTKIRDISGYVFPISTRSIRAAYDAALKKAGIEEFTFHDLRHTFATKLVQAGVDIYRVKELLGHRSIVMTMRYAHHYPESLRPSIDVLDKKSDNSPTIPPHSLKMEVAKNPKNL